MKYIKVGIKNMQPKIEQLDEAAIRLTLVNRQYELLRTRTEQFKSLKPVGLLILVNGMEEAGKGRAVTQLREWCDPRLLKVEATVGQKQASNHPIWLRHSKKLPRHGETGIYFGNWYADLIYTTLKLKSKHKKNKDWKAYLLSQLSILHSYEQDLANNHTRVIKFWFEIDLKLLKKRLKKENNNPFHLYQLDWLDEESVKEFNIVAQQILSQQSDWIIINGNNHEKATNIFIENVLNAWHECIRFSKHGSDVSTHDLFKWSEIPSELNDIVDNEIDKSEYKHKLEKQQQKLARLLRKCRHKPVIMVFEGVDAAGKGGAIRRLVSKLDPREYVIYSIAAPMQHEREHPYLWRFWDRLTTKEENRITIFDRSWYGRVLVERIEGYANEAEWQRAYDEMNRFESDLVDSGAIILKYWLAIDKNEQLNRFNERQDTPYKKHKLTQEDWRNREKWQEYVQATSDMLARTNTKKAPWCMVATNNKKTARLIVLNHAINKIQMALES